MALLGCYISPIKSTRRMIIVTNISWKRGSNKSVNGNDVFSKKLLPRHQLKRETSGVNSDYLCAYEKLGVFEFVNTSISLTRDQSNFGALLCNLFVARLAEARAASHTSTRYNSCSN